MSDRIEIHCIENTTHPKLRAGLDAHVIVCGNEKGGSGKTTTSMHVATSLLKHGFKVATIDLDSRQKTLTRYVENRRIWRTKTGADLELPNHYRFDQSILDSTVEAQMQDFSTLLRAISEIESEHDFIVIDTPGSDGYLMRLAHSMADTLLTPMNDSFVDFDVLGRVHSESGAIEEISHYAQMVREARRKRRDVDNGLLDWIVVRNRMSPLTSLNEQSVIRSVTELSMRLGFRVADGICERVIFREYFAKGLTALDDISTLGIERRTSKSHLGARDEISKLIKALRLPIDDQARQRVEARQMWAERTQAPQVQEPAYAD